VYEYYDGIIFTSCNLCDSFIGLCLKLQFSTHARAMTYSSISMLPVLLTILLLALEHTSEGIKYHVKPTDPEVAQCPGQPCRTLAEYLESKAWDFTFHANVVFMPGHHRVTQPFFIRFAFNLTLLGSTSVNHTLHDTHPILHIDSIWFDAVTNLNLMGITVIKSYELKKFPYAPLQFTSMFTLRISQIAVHSTRGGIDIIDVFENSVIEHSIFYTINYGSHITLRYMDVKHKHYYHKITIQDCIFTGSESICATCALEMNSFPVQIVISNITTIGEQVNDITLTMDCPGQPCQTLAEYLENKTWDYTSHAKVVIMPGHHRVPQLFLVRFAFNLTLLGSTSAEFIKISLKRFMRL